MDGEGRVHYMFYAKASVAQSTVPATSWAAEHGLFELASFLLALVAILLALGGVYAFINVRGVAKRQAREEAETVAKAIAETAAVSYLEAELPKLLRAYEHLAQNAVNDEEADEIAAAQPSGRDETP